MVVEGGTKKVLKVNLQKKAAVQKNSFGGNQTGNEGQ